MEAFDILIRRVAQLESVINDLNRRLNNTMREARVLEVDAAKGLAIVEAQGGKTKPVPWLQRAGSIRDWDPPAVGERVVLLSPNGDTGRGMILPGGYSQEYGQPHDQLGEARRVIGDSSDLFTGTQRVFEAQLITLRATTLRIEAGVEIYGPKVHHNDTNIGDTHKHTDVMPGGALTGFPV
jgi:phage baseplate assembly protein gpV